MEYWEELWDAADPDWRADPPEVVSMPPAYCDYLPGRLWRLKAIRHQSVDRLMLLGGQRFGYVYCVTNCPRCRACMPARIRIADFAYSKSQRRTIRRNLDLEIEVQPVVYSEEKFNLLLGFVEAKFGPRVDRFHDDAGRDSYYRSFHLHDPRHTREIHYRENGRLLGVSILDFGQQGLYSHYFFYDLRERSRRLGIFSFLKEIDWCKQLSLPYLYIGFLNEQAAALSYKAQFDCLEVLRPGVGWVPYRGRPKGSLSSEAEGEPSWQHKIPPASP